MKKLTAKQICKKLNEQYDLNKANNMDNLAFKDLTKDIILAYEGAVLFNYKAEEDVWVASFNDAFKTAYLIWIAVNMLPPFSEVVGKTVKLGSSHIAGFDEKDNLSALYYEAMDEDNPNAGEYVKHVTLSSDGCPHCQQEAKFMEIVEIIKEQEDITLFSTGVDEDDEDSLEDVSICSMKYEILDKLIKEGYIDKDYAKELKDIINFAKKYPDLVDIDATLYGETEDHDCEIIIEGFHVKAGAPEKMVKDFEKLYKEEYAIFEVRDDKSLFLSIDEGYKEDE